MASNQHLVYVSSRDLLDSLPANAALLSPEGDIQAVNTAWMDFAEQNGLRTPEYAIGTNYFSICEAAQGSDREISQQVAKGIHELRRGLRTAFSLQYPCHSPDKQCWYLLHATRLTEQPLSPILTLHEDITALVMNQERLASINSELAHMALFISHDVRAPLHTIQNYVELIRQNVGGMVEQSTAEYFNIVNATTKRLSTFVTEALNLALLSHEQHLPKEPLNLLLVVQEALQNVDQMVKEFEAAVTMDPLGTACGHRSYLVQLFQNLIGNAISHSGSKARVHIGVLWRDKQKLYFVQDFGPGIPTEYQESIFLPFRRVPASHSRGTGLGLALCRHIVEQHGGRLFVESKAGQGSTFYFSLSPNL